MSAPVPPPRRHKRRKRRPPKPGSGSDAADDEFELEPFYTKLAGPTGANQDDSEEEFVAAMFRLEPTPILPGLPRSKLIVALSQIELILEKCSIEELNWCERHKNHIKTSLPNVVDLVTATTEARPEDGARETRSLSKQATASDTQRELADDEGDYIYSTRNESEFLSSPDVSTITGEASRRYEDTGYQSRTENRPFPDISQIFNGNDELSMFILKDTDEGDLMLKSKEERVIQTSHVHRTISKESLPHEMLIGFDEEDEENQMQSNDKNSAIDEGFGFNELIKENGIHEFVMLPPSPALNNHLKQLDVVESLKHPLTERSRPARASNCTSMTPSLNELEVAITDIFEKIDESEGLTDKEDKLPALQIAIFEEVLEPSKSRLIDFPRTDRTNPFNDFKSADLESPEKPGRLHRVSLMEDPVLEKSEIVPTPPRRRYRSKLNLIASIESLHTPDDRLI